MHTKIKPGKTTADEVEIEGEIVGKYHSEANGEYPDVEGKYIGFDWEMRN